VSGTSSDSSSLLATKFTGTINITGDGATETTQTVNLSSTGKVMNLTLQGITGLPLQDAIPGVAGTVTTNDMLRLLAFDSVTGLPLGRVQLSNDVATNDVSIGALLVDSGFTDVVIAIVDFTDQLNDFGGALNPDVDLPNTVLGLYRNSSLTSDDFRTLQQFEITGAIEPTQSGALDATDTASVTIDATDVPTNLTPLYGNTIPLADAAITPGTGVFTVNLFPGSHAFGATDVKSFPDFTQQDINITTETNVSIPVSVGGAITGRVQQENNDNISGISISIFPQNSLTDVTIDLDEDALVTVTTDADGVYSLELTFGTYDLWINGALSSNLVLSSSISTLTVDLRRYQVSGRIIDQNGGGLAGTANLIGSDTDVAGGIGVYTVDVYTGLNNICFIPPGDRPTLGNECSFSFVVNQTTIDALRAP
jgi:hypothetical protein